MFDKIENLRRFIGVAEIGTLQEAAETLGVTQPAMTRSIQLLEEQMGAPLFDRHSRGLHLTQLGERALRHAKHVIRECQLAQADLDAIKLGERGSLNIGAAPVWMTVILPFAVAEINGYYPHLNIEMNSYDYPSALPKLMSGQLDLYCGGWYPRNDSLPSYLVRRSLTVPRLSIIANEDHPLHKVDTVTPEMLLEFPWLSYHNDEAYFDVVMSRIEKQIGKRKDAVVHCQSILSTLLLLRRGPFLTYLPGTVIESVPELNLKLVKTDFAELGIDSGIIFRRSLLSNVAFRRFIDFAEEKISKTDYLDTVG